MSIPLGLALSLGIRSKALTVEDTYSPKFVKKYVPKNVFLRRCDKGFQLGRANLVFAFIGSESIKIKLFAVPA